MLTFLQLPHPPLQPYHRQRSQSTCHFLFITFFLESPLYSSCFNLSLQMLLTPIASLNTPPSHSSVYPKAFHPSCFQFHSFFWRPPLHLLPEQYFIFIKIALHFLSLTPLMAAFLTTLLFPMEPCQVRHSCWWWRLGKLGPVGQQAQCYHNGAAVEGRYLSKRLSCKILACYVLIVYVTVSHPELPFDKMGGQ